MSAPSLHRESTDSDIHVPIGTYIVHPESFVPKRV